MFISVLVSLLTQTLMAWPKELNFSYTRMPIAILDTGLDLSDPRFADVLCATGHKDFTGEGIRDYVGHGTHVAGILAKAAPDHSKYCIVIIKVVDRHRVTEGKMLRGLRYVAAKHYPLVNMSLSGTEPDAEERRTIATSGTVFVVAAGNDNLYYKLAYPGGYNLPNIRTVGNWDCRHNKIGADSNYGEGIIWRCGTDIKSTLPNGTEGVLSGTSMATPLYTAELINAKK